MEYNNNGRKVAYTTILEDSNNATTFKHFKNKDYKIITVANHSETWEELVIYYEIGNETHCCARPIDMFFSKVDKEKYPDIEQEYRFEKLD